MAEIQVVHCPVCDREYVDEVEEMPVLRKHVRLQHPEYTNFEDEFNEKDD